MARWHPGCRRAAAARARRAGIPRAAWSPPTSRSIPPTAGRAGGSSSRTSSPGLDRAAAERVLAALPRATRRCRTGAPRSASSRSAASAARSGTASSSTASRPRSSPPSRPYLAPLVRMLDDGSPVGVVARLARAGAGARVGAGRDRGARRLGAARSPASTGTSARRRAATRPRGTGASASGRDQYAQRLEHNRERFLKQAGGLVASRYGERAWRQIVVIGEGDRPRLLARGMGPQAELVHEVRQDLIRAAPAEIGERLERGARAPQPQPRGGAGRASSRRRSAATPGPPSDPEEVLEALERGPGPARDLRRHARVGTARRRARLRADDRARARHQGAGSPRSRASPRRALAEHDGAAALLRY